MIIKLRDKENTIVNLNHIICGQKSVIREAAYIFDLQHKVRIQCNYNCKEELIADINDMMEHINGINQADSFSHDNDSKKMNIDVDRYDLEELVRVTGITYNESEHPLAAKAGHPGFNPEKPASYNPHSWDNLPSLSDVELLELYKICKESWKEYDE